MTYNSTKNIIFISLLVTLLVFGGIKVSEHIINRKSDDCDAPKSYGLAIHNKPDIGPFFGKMRGNSNNEFNDSIYFAFPRASNQNLDDVFDNNQYGSDSSILPVFAPDIIVENDVYNISIPLNGATGGDAVRGWIDFDGNGSFEEKEKASAEYVSSSKVTLSWRLPLQITNTLTYLRLRTCRELYKEDIEFPAGKANTGEVEDYPVRIRKSVIPSAEMKEKIDFTGFIDAKNLVSTEKIINNLSIGNTKFAITLEGTKPDIAGINNMHDASFLGIRLGHEAKTVITKKNPIIIKLKAAKPLQNFNFQIADIDAGDRIKIEGFNNNEPVKFEISNLTDNYYFQYNINTNEVYGDAIADAGGLDFIQSSLDMGINIGFIGLVDSVRLTYSDDAEKTSGTFTLANFSARKYQMQDVEVRNFVAKDSAQNVHLKWEVDKYEQLASYNVERSDDSRSFEVIFKSELINGNKYSYKDNSFPSHLQTSFYRIKLIEKDNHVYISPVFRLRRNLSQSLTGFKPIVYTFKDELKLLLLKDMPNEIKISMFNYGVKKVKEWTFSNKKAGDIILLNSLNNLLPYVYYIEFQNNNIKYLVEVSNNK